MPTEPSRPTICDALLSYDDLAALFRRKRSVIPNTILGWQRARHFPEPLPGKRKLWSAARVQEWIDCPTDEARAALALERQRQAQQGAAPKLVVETQRRTLEARYGGRAA